MMSSLDQAASIELAKQIGAKADRSFDNAYRAVLAIENATYVQGFLVTPMSLEPIEHGWIEVDDRILDPTLPHLPAPDALQYFPAQRLSLKKLKAAVEEAQEDYPEDESLPVYEAAPYAYYGNVMLGGQDYLDAYEAAKSHCNSAADLN
ncbi:MAG: hypothetical protein F6K28_46685 [Microcoleus sp. SIO2G3]|nr:hypothetical protein [Microcoleus sp. SIO2G3]